MFKNSSVIHAEKFQSIRDTLSYIVLFNGVLAVVFWAFRESVLVSHLSQLLIFTWVLSMPGRITTRWFLDVLILALPYASLLAGWVWFAFDLLGIEKPEHISVSMMLIAAACQIGSAFLIYKLIRLVSGKPNAPSVFVDK